MALNRRLSFDQARLIRQNRILARNGIDPSGQWTPFRGYLILILLRHATRCESNNASIVSQLTYFRPASCHMFSTPAWGSFAVTLIFCQGILSSMFSRDSKYSPLFPGSWNAATYWGESYTRRSSTTLRAFASGSRPAHSVICLN